MLYPRHLKQAVICEAVFCFLIATSTRPPENVPSRGRASAGHGAAFQHHNPLSFAKISAHSPTLIRHKLGTRRHKVQILLLTG
jgi:hypothetical protein